MSDTDNNISDFDRMTDILNKTGVYSGLTSGISMEPLIHHQKDNIIVAKTSGRLNKYDIPVYRGTGGKIIMHRIVKVCDDHYEIFGDNTNRREIVTDDMIAGKLVGFYKNGKKYIDLEKNKAYKVYSRFWVAILPLRPLTMFINRGIRFVKRRILKRGN